MKSCYHLIQAFIKKLQCAITLQSFVTNIFIFICIGLLLSWILVIKERYKDIIIMVFYQEINRFTFQREQASTKQRVRISIDHIIVIKEMIEVLNGDLL